ncbi:MAG: C-GCAxxG-C-C family protein [Firmicutes bacterium]|nr:C-GCAxxG-C-C family protein [Bacillota bacterium]
MEKEIKKYQNKEIYDYSCSETIIHAANDYYQLNLSKAAFKMMAPFSGGMYERDVCGIMSACISVLGILFTKENSHNSPLLKEATISLRNAFLTEFGSANCQTLTDTLKDPVFGCRDLVLQGGTILKNTVSIYQNIEKNNEVKA